MLASSLLIVPFAETGVYLLLYLQEDFIAFHHGAEDLLSAMLQYC